ncbi:MAG: hypothetical protein FWD23_12545, partial [Oscillospiraceae bacterium]|nr:hypothetical protein [Oscillospiraceae bacterium]
MPVIKIGETYPSWCEVVGHGRIKVAKETPYIVKMENAKKAVVALTGSCIVDCENEAVKLSERKSIFTAEEEFTIKAVGCEYCEVMVIYGHWGEKTGGIGVFTVDKSDSPNNPGTKTDYYRNTAFDNHYHDCDEYWIIVEGSGTV